VPADWVDRYKGKFDDGWDAYREQTLARQIELGVVPPDTKMAPKPADIADWDTLPADEKRLHARQMEIFAAFAEHTDHEAGRLVDAIVLDGLPHSVEEQLHYLDDMGRSHVLPALSSGLGCSHERAVPVDQAGRLSLRRPP
jgi:hypothetical protein